MNDYFKSLIQRFLQRFGKRITNFYAPAKPYELGVAFLKDLGVKPQWIIDVGVADGTKEITTTFPLGEYKYLLIDANPKFVPYMEEMAKKHSEMIAYENCFCGEKEEVIPFHLNRTGHYSSRYSTKGLTETIQVDVKRLDSLAVQHKIEGPVFMKVDVEGAELDVLKGATQTLKSCEVVILESWINVETNNKERDFASIVSFMKEQSFVVFDFFGGHTFKSGVLQHVDVVFVREDSPYRMIRKK